MKSNLKTKLIQHIMGKKNSEKGFTLIELLVVIIIIGILAAIALPSFLNQANKARQSEAKNYVGSMNRAQQAYYLEKSQFANTIDLLGLGISTSTDNYAYNISTDATGTASDANGTPTTVTEPAKASKYVNAFGTPKVPALKGYAGTTWLGSTGTEATTTTALFESTKSDPTDNTKTKVIGLNAAPANTTATAPTGMDAIK